MKPTKGKGIKGQVASSDIYSTVGNTGQGSHANKAASGKVQSLVYHKLMENVYKLIPVLPVHVVQPGGPRPLRVCWFGRQYPAVAIYRCAWTSLFHNLGRSPDTHGRGRVPFICLIPTPVWNGTPACLGRGMRLSHLLSGVW